MSLLKKLSIKDATQLRNQLAQQNFNLGDLSFTSEEVVAILKSLKVAQKSRTFQDLKTLTKLLRGFKFSNSVDGIEESELQILARSLELVVFNKNDHIIDIDQISDCVYLIFSGRVGIMLPRNISKKIQLKAQGKQLEKLMKEKKEQRKKEIETLLRLQHKFLALLYGGSIIGEMGVISNTQR